MANEKLYPPSIEGKLPAFAGNTLTIPITPNRAVHTENGTEVRVLIKTVQTGVEKLSLNGRLYQNSDNNKWTASFQEAFQNYLTIGQYYKVQVAYLNGNDVGYYSSVGIIKYTTFPTLSIPQLENNKYSVYEYTGVYSQEGEDKDSTEKIYSYRFDLRNGNQDLIATSGDQLHNSEKDSQSTSKTVDVWLSKIELENNKIHYLTYSVTTMNGLTHSSRSYQVMRQDSVDAEIDATLLGEMNYDDGCVQLYFQPLNPNANKEIIINGSFALIRTDSKSDFKNWDEVQRFTYSNVRFNDISKLLLWEDFTVQHGIEYLYALQAFNEYGLYSNKIYNVNNIYDLAPNKILVDFEDAFLYDGERQLKIRFNPKISSFKETVLESKTDTIGSQFPFIFRNGKVNYKEFPISGLISLISDPNERFLKGIQTTNQLPEYRLETPSYDNPPGLDTVLTSNNIQREREFKLEVLEWLNNGKPKVFRSPTEGNYIVRLMNISLSPNDTLGRMLHTFQCTAYEISEFNFNNLLDLNLINLPAKDLKCLKIGQIMLNSSLTNSQHFTKKDNLITFTINALLPSITEATPGTVFSLISNTGEVEVEIGGTGSYYINSKNIFLTGIKLVSGAWDNAKLTFSYETQAEASNFNKIVKIELNDEIRQFIGTDFNVNIVKDKNKNLGMTDIRREIGTLHYIKVSKRPIETIYQKNSNEYYLYRKTKDDGSYSFENKVKFNKINLYYVITINNLNFYGEFKNNSLVQINANKIEYKFALNPRNENDYSDLEGRPNSYCTKCKTKLTPNGVCPTCNTKYFGDTFGRFEAIYNVEQANTLRISNGLYMELAYQVRTKTYDIEKTNTFILDAKTTWKSKRKEWEDDQTSSKFTAMQNAYQTYISRLEAGLNAEEV